MTTVPDKYDVVINGQGFMCCDIEEIKAQYGFTPTFVPRSNTQGDFGDNFQDFWLTSTQRDWSLGALQRYFHQDDPASVRRFLSGNLDVSQVGAFSLAPDTADVITNQTADGCAGPDGTLAYFTQLANLNTVDSAGTVVDLGVHGLGTNVLTGYGMVSDNSAIYMASTSGASVGVRKYKAAAFSTFSATTADSIAFLNNTLYGAKNSTAELFRYDSAGAVSSIFIWKGADGVANATTFKRLRPFGGKLLILKKGDNAYELWQFDGVGVSILCRFPPGFVGAEVEVLEGVIYVSGNMKVATPDTAFFNNPVSIVFFYVNGQMGTLYESPTLVSPATAYAGLGLYRGRLVIAEGNGYTWFYSPESGGLQGRYVAHASASTRNKQHLVSCDGFYAHFQHGSNQTTQNIYPGTAFPSTATMISSAIDFGSSLTKVFRGIKVDFDPVSGSTVDIQYFLDGSTTPVAVQTTAVSGTEYLLSGVVGNSINVIVIIHAGSGTSVRVRKVSVRAIPQQASFRKGTLVLACWGRDGKSPIQLRDGTHEPKDGQALALLLNAVVTSGVPIAITDQFGALAAAVIDAEGFQLRQIRANEYIAVVPYRQV